MKLISVNVGVPRTVVMNDRSVTTGIFKVPVNGPVRLRHFSLDGDGQADLENHGGTNKAVYLYPSEHYSYWQQRLGREELPWGIFGENFTTEGLSETETRIGDQFRIGSAIVMVTQPRMPCYKLAGKFGIDDFVRQFLESGRVGFYASVVEEGTVVAGDSIEMVRTDGTSPTVAEIVSLHLNERGNVELLRRAAATAALSEEWRENFRRQLEAV